MSGTKYELTRRSQLTFLYENRPQLSLVPRIKNPRDKTVAQVLPLNRR